MDKTTIILTIFSSVLASSGVWAVILKRIDKNDAKAVALQCLLRDRILECCEKYGARGWADTDERTNVEQLMKAYEGLGGDGVVHNIYDRFTALPYTQPQTTQTQTQEEQQ